MKRYISRKLVHILSLGLFILFVGYTLPGVGEVKSRISSEYFKHKEFLLNLRLAKGVRKSPADESSVGNLLGKLGLKPESLYVSDTGVEVRLEVSWSSLPELISEIEKRYRIVSFSAVDNTGKGLFKVRLVVR